MTENRRRALAESYFEVGEADKAEELFWSWLAADPRWGFGWVAWAACHSSPLGRDSPRDYASAEQMLGYLTPCGSLVPEQCRTRPGLGETPLVPAGPEEVRVLL